MRERIYLRVGMVGFDTYAEVYSCDPAYDGCLSKGYVIDPSDNKYVESLFSVVKKQFNYDYSYYNYLPLIVQDYAGGRTRDGWTGTLEKQKDGRYHIEALEPHNIDFSLYDPWHLSNCVIKSEKPAATPIEQIQDRIHQFGESTLCPYFLNDSDKDPVNIEFNGQVLSSFDIENIGKNAKRRGDYDLSLKAYICLIDACKKQNGKVNVWVIQCLYKTLICMNEFSLAYLMISNVVFWLGNKPHSTSLEYNIADYFNVLREFAIETIQLQTDTNVRVSEELRNYCKACSGSSSYVMAKDDSDIVYDFFVTWTLIEIQRGHSQAK